MNLENQLDDELSDGEVSLERVEALIRAGVNVNHVLEGFTFLSLAAASFFALTC